MTSSRTSFELTSTQQWYLDTLMSKVSRSFAVVVRYPEEPLNHVIATAYLLYRVVDNRAIIRHRVQAPVRGKTKVE